MERIELINALSLHSVQLLKEFAWYVVPERRDSTNVGITYAPCSYVHLQFTEHSAHVCRVLQNHLQAAR